jgi:hypothetical protein
MIRAVARKRLPHLAFMGGVACAAGCADDGATTTAVVFDSAGITIAASPADVLSDLPSWRLAEPPQVEIGVVEDDRGHQLSEVAGAALLPDGTILVGDGGSRELRLFAASGRTLRVFGGEGEGPGELPFLRAIAVLPGDTVVASAWPFGLLSRFALDGTFLGSVRLGPFWPGVVAEILRDGSLLFDLYDRGYGNDIETWAASGTEPLFRPRGWLVRVFPDGRQYTLREIGGQQWFKTGEPRQDLWLAPRPFGPTSSVAVAGSRIYIGNTERAEIEVLSLGGELRGLIRWEEEAVPVTDADRDRVRETALASLRQPARRSHLEGWLEEVPYPEYKPAFSALFADRAGRLWIQAPTPAGALNDRWIVFDVDGHSLASLGSPAGARLLDAGDDSALLVWKNSLDQEFVRLYRIEK